MKLKDALKLAKTGGGYVVHNNNFTEYSQQLFYKNGVLYWTAGYTVGGEVSEGRMESIKSQYGLGGFDVHKNFQYGRTE